MRAELFLCVTFLLLLPFARSRDTSPFYNALLRNADLERRQQNSCPEDYNSCYMLGAADACCEPDTICSMDASDNIACCPTGAACTGLVPTSAGDEAPSSTTDTGFRFPEPGTATITGSTIPSAPFPFMYVPTSFRDQAECVQSYSGCQSQFEQCTSSLGGAYGVTVGGNDGFGTTVNGVAPTLDAQSVCSSLRGEACYGLQVGYCTAFTGGGSSGGAPLTRSSALYEIVAGLAIALAGMVA